MRGHGLFKTRDSVAMAQAVSRWSVIAENRLRSQAGSCEMRCGKLALGLCFFPPRVQGGMLQRTMLQRTNATTNSFYQ